ncbi:Hypothetical protein Tpal_397 [Trichococcus palustris]|jgi:hypothetical protein|uniref:DUF1189 domain-containing protein n=1 Tax=Trichococcus palustris TaxID=140314 RepID=A0A143Y7Z4_9LACT|nr:DUF1189 family protein [Trichococcus palustris]CZQ83096.1 Hypothetical protein Tpal_397 [Trichococcus palustris]SFK68940.1 Protein of unknown function [Trichococcus palustris]
MITITIVRLIKESFIDPKQLSRAKQLKKSASSLLFFILSLAVSIPIFMSSFPILQNLGADAQAVAQKIPAFTIIDDELVLDEPMEKGFIYKTDTVMLTFDPKNSYSERDLASRSENFTLSLFFSRNEFVLYAGGIPLTIPYTQADKMTDQFFKSLLTDFTKNQTLSVFILFIFCFVVSAIELSLSLLIISLFANILSSLVGKRQTFFDNWNMALVAISVPALFFVLLNGFGFVAYFQEEIIVALALYYYYNAVKDTKQIPEA